MGAKYLRRSIVAAAALVALTAAGAGAADAGTISGLVTDLDGQPVNGALVVVRDTNRFATTNADGYYVITPAPVGAFDVKASRIGHREQVKTGVKVIAGLRTNVSFQLESEPKFYSPFYSEEPLIKFPLFKFSSPYNEQIETQVVDEFADMLARTPGVVYEDADASTLDLDIRGGPGSDVADTGTISGLVTDQEGGPVEGALVVVKGADRFATTNADGYYSIQKVPVGAFDVKASRVGCGEQVESGVRVIAGLRTNLSFRLR